MQIMSDYSLVYLKKVKLLIILKFLCLFIYKQFKLWTTITNFFINFFKLCRKYK